MQASGNGSLPDTTRLQAEAPSYAESMVWVPELANSRSNNEQKGHVQHKDVDYGECIEKGGCLSAYTPIGRSGSALHFAWEEVIKHETPPDAGFIRTKAGRRRLKGEHRGWEVITPKSYTP